MVSTDTESAHRMPREVLTDAKLDQYPTIRGYPHIFVLEADGTFLHSQNTAELEKGRSYDEEVLLAFLEEWMPSMDGS